MPVTIPKPLHKPRLGSRLGRKHPLSRGLVSRWLLNEGGGAKAWNIANPNNHGTLTNMDPTTDWITTPRGPVLTFDQSNDHIVCSRVDLTAYPYSLVAWVAPPPARAAATGGLITLDSSSSTAHRIDLLTTDAHQFELFVRAGGTSAAATSPSAYNDGLLHLVVGVGVAVNSFILYVDGKQVGTSTNNTASFPTLNTQTIGARRTTTTVAYLEGPLHEVAIYNRALSAAEIERMYKEPYANIIQQQYRSRFIAAAAGATTRYHYLASMGVGPVTR